MSVDTGAKLIPCLRYRDAPAALDWRCTTCGWVRQLVVRDEGGGIAHAQLLFGSG